MESNSLILKVPGRALGIEPAAISPATPMAMIAAALETSMSPLTAAVAAVRVT